MKTLLTLLLSCTTLLAGPGIPALRSIVTTTNGFELRWECSLTDVQAFQIMRLEKASNLPPLPAAATPTGQTVRWFTLNPEKLLQVMEPLKITFFWKDTNAVAGVTYGYSVIALGVDGQSKPSNELTVKR